MKQATSALEGLSVAEKNELLFQHGINFNDLPRWQKRGSAVCWEEYQKQGRNPKTGESVTARRRWLRRDLDLPMGDEYSLYVEKLVNATLPAGGERGSGGSFS
jgi:tRNA(His) 5'-end guanylyltransferase